MATPKGQATYSRRREGHLIVSDAKTSARMAGVRRRDTSPETRLRQHLHALGLRYRLENRDLSGSPDVANRSRRWAIFVHGCFWHRHAGCRRTTTPKRNRDFWRAKFERNQARDARVQRELRALGYRVLVVWECETERADFPGWLRRRLQRARILPKR
jgi:DNA mismatch endonuclease (patch repair protein)